MSKKAEVPTVPALTEAHPPYREAKERLDRAVAELRELHDRDKELQDRIREHRQADHTDEYVDAYVASLDSEDGGTAVAEATEIQTMQEERDELQGKIQVVGAAVRRLRREAEREEKKAARIAFEEIRPAYREILTEVKKKAEALAEVAEREAELRTALRSEGVRLQDLQTSLASEQFRDRGRRNSAKSVGKLIEEIEEVLAK